MGLTIEARATVTYTCHLSDEDELKVLEEIRNNPEEYKHCSDDDAITNAVWNLWGNCEINIYEDATESDCITEEIYWSCYENRDATEIIEEFMEGENE